VQPQIQSPWAKPSAPDAAPPERFRRQLLALPNILTLTRVIPIPAIYLCLRRGEPFYEGMALALIVVALSTDFFDGYIARRQGLKTQLGLILDPTADKVLISSLAVMGALFKGLPVWMAAVIVGKDVLVFAGAAAIYLRRRMIFASDRWGRATTMAVSLAFILYFVIPGPHNLYAVGLAIGCIGFSSVAYARKFLLLFRVSGPSATPT
jgi:CDP-diacylglycerol--glycerol-3-phosphate 3-phosphatidyltransferase